MFVNSKVVMFLVVLAIFGTLCYAQDPSDHFRAGFKLLEGSESAICSKNSYYCMSFTTLDSTNDQHTYLNIHETLGKVVWKANRNEPLLNSSLATLTLNMSGVLEITRQDGTPIILYSLPSNDQSIINNTVATLFDSGNFVLQQILSNTSRIDLWQSFDYPTDTLLPGMRLGFDAKTGKNWSLVSNLADSSSALGPFTLEWDHQEKQLIIRRRGQICWASGALKDNRKFENIPEEAQKFYEYTITSSKDNEESFQYKLTNDLGAERFSPWTLYYDGKLSNKEMDIVDASKCYGYNTEGGCQTWKQPNCRQEGDIFVFTIVRPRELEMTVIEDDNVSLSISDCRATCWSDCDCIGYINNDNGTGCNYIYEHSKGAFIGNEEYSIYYLIKGTTKNNDKDPNNPSLAPRPLGQSPESNAGKRKAELLIAIVILIPLLIIWAIIILLLLRKRKLMLKDKKRRAMKYPRFDQLETSSVFENSNESQNYNMNGRHDLRLFSYTSIMEATDYFSIENKLGEGGFGPVYKGKLPMGKEVAVKRLSRRSGQGVTHFKTELRLIYELQHMSLVQLLGYCIHEDERILVYEYMPNKSLDFFLYDSTQSNLLDWKTRLNIIEGIVQGLLYLHKYSRLRVVHRDLKASNILLDENMNPKISDFGLARIVTGESERNTSRLAGTYGYMPPEQANGVFSTKSDVYSFGILILEIVSGQRNNSFYNKNNSLNIVGYAWGLWKEDLALEMVDKVIRDSIMEDQVLRCIHIGLLCVEECANDRPTMAEVSSMLSNESAKLPSHKRPAFCFVNESLRRSCNDSTNGLTISDLSAR